MQWKEEKKFIWDGQEPKLFRSSKMCHFTSQILSIRTETDLLKRNIIILHLTINKWSTYKCGDTALRETFFPSFEYFCPSFRRSTIIKHKVTVYFIVAIDVDFLILFYFLLKNLTKTVSPSCSKLCDTNNRVCWCINYSCLFFTAQWINNWHST